MLAGNELDPPYEEEVDGWFGGVLRMLEALWEFICAVVSAIADAVMAALNFIMEFIMNAIAAIVKAFIDGMKALFEPTVMNIASAVKLFLNPHPATFGQATIIINDEFFGTSIFELTTAVMYGLMALEVIATAIFPGTQALSQLLVPILLSALAGVFVGMTVMFIVDEIAEDLIGSLLQTFGLVADLIFFFLMFYAKFTERAKKFITLVNAVGESILALGIGALSGAVEEKYGKGSITSRVIDMLAWLLTVKALGDFSKGYKTDPWLRLTKIWKVVCTAAVLGSFGFLTAALGWKYGNLLLDQG